MARIGAAAVALALLATSGCNPARTMWEGRHWAKPGITPWPLTIWVHGSVKDPDGYGPVDRFARGLEDELFERGLVPRMTVSTYPPPAPPMLELHVAHWSVPGAGAAVALVSPIAPAVLIIVECKTHPLPPNPFDFRVESRPPVIEIVAGRPS